MDILYYIGQYIKLANTRATLLNGNYNEQPITSEESVLGIKKPTKEEQLETVKTQMKEALSDYSTTCYLAPTEDLIAAFERINLVVAGLEKGKENLERQIAWTTARAEEQRRAGITISAKSFEDSKTTFERSMADLEFSLGFYSYFRANLETRLGQKKLK